MRRFLIRTAIFTSCAFLSVLGGCLGGSSPSRFYLLSPLSASESPVAASGVAIGVGPISLPQYLDRSQIVTRKGENQLHLAEFDRWAESLQKSFTRVLVLNLSTLLSTDRVALHPWNRSTPIDYQVIVDVARCDNCRLCFLAVKDEYIGNEFPGYSAAQPVQGHSWLDIERKERGAYPLVEARFMPVMCNHCDDAPCIKAARDGAITKRHTETGAFVKEGQAMFTMVSDRDLEIEADVPIFCLTIRIPFQSESSSLLFTLLIGRNP